MMTKKKPHNEDRTQDESQQQSVRMQKRLFNIQVAEQQQHHSRQPRPIQDPISNAKTRDSFHIQEIAKSISGVWIVDHRIWALYRINSRVHLV